MEGDHDPEARTAASAIIAAASELVAAWGRSADSNETAIGRLTALIGQLISVTAPARQEAALREKNS